MSACLVYVDDEPLLCRAFRTILAEHQVPVETFTRPTDALDFITANDVAVVVCDYRMPECNGLQMLDQIKKQIPFYLVSGDLDVAQLAKTRERVSGVLTKPFAPNLIVELARRHIATA